MLFVFLSAISCYAYAQHEAKIPSPAALCVRDGRWVAGWVSILPWLEDTTGVPAVAGIQWMLGGDHNSSFQTFFLRTWPEKKREKGPEIHIPIWARQACWTQLLWETTTLFCTASWASVVCFSFIGVKKKWVGGPKVGLSLKILHNLNFWWSGDSCEGNDCFHRDRLLHRGSDSVCGGYLDWLQRCLWWRFCALNGIG